MNFKDKKEQPSQRRPEFPPIIPNEARLREAALAHVARFATTRKNLRLVLQRRVKRWAIRAEKAGMLQEDIIEKESALMPIIEKILSSMDELGAVDDSAFARSRVKTLLRSGHSRRATMGHLVGKGVESDLAQQMIEEKFESFHDDYGVSAELGAALILARKRGIGPFQRVDREAKDTVKILALFARNGFTHDIAERVLGMEREEAEDIILAFQAA